MLCGWEGNCRPGGILWQATTWWITYGHLRPDCLYISSGPNNKYGKPLSFLNILSIIHLTLSLFLHYLVILENDNCCRF